MGTLGYYIALPLIYLVAWLPFPLLYLFSDLLYLVLYRVFRYRVTVVRSNLHNSFPERDRKELRRIESDFYRWFADLVLETVKTLTISRRSILKRVAVENVEVLERWHAEGRSVILVLGHLGNWELAGARFSQLGLHKLNVIYHPLANPHFERLIVRMRTRLGNGLYPMRDTVKCMIRDRDRMTATAFIADQTPSPEKGYWMEFLRQDTPVFRGTGGIARKMDLPVVYISVDRPARGHYVLRFEDLVPEPSALPEETITEIHTRRLEQDIRRRPEIWLWTHKRWKHKRPSS